MNKQKATAFASSLAFMVWSATALAATTLSELSIEQSGEQGRIQVQMRFDGEVPDPSSFAVESPARISIDLPDTRIGLGERSQKLDRSALRSWIALEDAKRTRVVLELDRLHPHVLRREGNMLVADIFATNASLPLPTNSDSLATARIAGIDFRRSEKGAGQIQIDLDGPVANVDVRDEGGNIIVDFPGTELDIDPQTLDVLDFATPVNTVEIKRLKDSVRLTARPVINSQFERLAYQVGDQFTLELAPLSQEEIARRKKAQKEYSGERINFSFQKVELRALLQIIADIAGKNLVVSDSVTGELTLRLENVPWDQALDIVLKTKGLTKNIDGDVLWVAPTAEVAANEKQELEALKQREQLSPLVTEVIQINYANVVDLEELIGKRTGGSSGDNDSFLSERGKVSVDERTNVLIIQDTREKLAEIRAMVQRLDIPVRQVLIEARIVVANDDFRRSIGARAGITGATTNGDTLFSTSGNIYDAAAITNGVYENGGLNSNGTVPIIPDLTAADSSRLNLNLAADNPDGFNPAGIALAILGKDYLLDLELSAIQAEGKGEVVSSPRVLTANGMEAYIEQGEEIPYTSVTANRVTTLFKKAFLALRVTPQITPDGRVIMTLDISRDAAGRFVPQTGGGSVPAIDARRLNTQVLVNNGETVVLGGVFEQTDSDSMTKVPLLGDIPILGALFRYKAKSSTSRELLIFVTPKIINDRLSLR